MMALNVFDVPVETDVVYCYGVDTAPVAVAAVAVPRHRAILGMAVQSCYNEPQVPCESK